MNDKLWHGRFTSAPEEYTDAWAASIDFDKRLYADDIEGSLAHAAMLMRIGILSSEELDSIRTGLIAIKGDIESGALVFGHETEDIHMSIESELTKRIGDAGKKLHTARSRNDQVATDTRLYLRRELGEVTSALEELRETLTSLARVHKETVMPGYTHLQHAQPVSFAFHLLAYREMLARDASRFADCLKRINVMPLGSGALAGTSYESDRSFLASELGFDTVSANAMDAVSDRDFAIEFISAASIAMMHLSRFCEEIILWSSSEFGFIELSDAYSTGSSIMPQKKNPDMAELIRGKTGRVYGDLISLLTVMKGLPLAYNKDMQEDKEPLFDAADTLISCLKVFTGMLGSLEVRKERMEEASRAAYMNATDAADYLAKKGIPFRECHEIIGRLVLACIERGCAIDDLGLDELRTFSDMFEEDIYDKLTPLACMNAKLSQGSTSEKSVEEQLA